MKVWIGQQRDSLYVATYPRHRIKNLEASEGGKEVSLRFRQQLLPTLTVVAERGLLDATPPQADQCLLLSDLGCCAALCLQTWITAAVH